MIKKLGFLTAAIWVISLIIMPLNSFAKMTTLSDNELRQITGQAGIAIQPEDVYGMNIDAERLARNDGDGDNFGTAFALANAMPGITFSEPSEMDHKFATQIVSDADGVAGINLTIDDLDVRIDEMTTDLRLGSNNASDSLGIFTMRGFHAHISGNVRIYTRSQ
jgi:uncharacterized protein DUF6160